jgi:hypothetical protein
MQDSLLAAMKSALRVLSAITDKKPPDPADIAELRRIDPAAQDLDVDELARKVIQQCMGNRPKTRNSSGGNRGIS